MVNICTLKDDKTHHKGHCKWDTLNYNSKSFLSKDKTKLTFNLQDKEREKSQKWSRTFKKNSKIQCINHNLNSVLKSKDINKSSQNRTNLDSDLQPTSELNQNFQKLILAVKQLLFCPKFVTTVFLKKIFEEIELSL